jgi:hypothetical protein
VRARLGGKIATARDQHDEAQREDAKGGSDESGSTTTALQNQVASSVAGDPRPRRVRLKSAA